MSRVLQSQKSSSTRPCLYEADGADERVPNRQFAGLFVAQTRAEFQREMRIENDGF